MTQKYIHERQLRVTNFVTKKSLLVRHIHFEGWPEWNVPDVGPLQAIVNVFMKGCDFIRK
jgi:hypothetical protein